MTDSYDLSEVVGKTVSNVSFEASPYGYNRKVIVEFTDKSCLVVTGYASYEEVDMDWEVILPAQKHNND